MKFEEAFPHMREGKIIKSKSTKYGLKFNYETFGCEDNNDRMMIAHVNDEKKIICYSSLESEDLLKEDYEVIK
ncbi:hypothetical protein NKR74_14890 [Bacillus sp. 3103sda1]|uniref:hypothetical protein n=1 Tax=Bacillus sp. 3103sda1 TaxID=2953808 RepID=UPI0020A0FB27|nr:hypothetical protein [Bacillus sp. 3103sda1]MCP1124575.1 hypothetical protein [Bacillus sp. 3103sda1]